MAYGGGGNPQGFSEQELEHYQFLFRQADAVGRGRIEGAAGAELLRSTGLPEDQLHRIWEIADTDNGGSLDAQKFCVVCRLVAHAQAGQPPSQYLASVEPQLLPEFQGVRRLRQPSETSSRGGSPSPSAAGAVAPSELSELQPIIAGGEEQVRRAAQAVRQASRSPARRPFTQAQWAPSQREKRKYATLFKRVDWDSDGFVLGHEAKDLLSRSGLDEPSCQTAWNLADMDRDGKLSFHEFVCLVHMVTCAVRGARLPAPHEGPPQELLHALSALESVQALLAEREASRSRSTSPAPSGFLSVGDIWSPRREGGGVGIPAEPMTAAGPPPAETLAAASDFGTASALQAVGTAPTSPLAPAMESGFGTRDDFGFAGAFGDGFGDGAFDQGAKGRRRHDAPFTGDFGAGDHSGAAFPVEDAFGGGPSPGSRGSRRSGGSDGRGREPFFGTNGAHEDSMQNQEQLAALSTQFESIMAADREVCRQLRREVDELQQELRHLDDLRRQVDDQLRQCRDTQVAAASEQAALEQRVATVRRRLQETHEQRRSLNLESVSLRKDRTHCEEELAFLRQLAEDEAGSLEAARQANGMLETAYQEIEGHAEALERQRRNLAMQVQTERDLARQEERHTASLRIQLEQLLRQQVANEAGRKETLRRYERTRELQDMGRPVVMATGVLQPPAGHSWAATIGTTIPGEAPGAAVSAT